MKPRLLAALASTFVAVQSAAQSGRPLVSAVLVGYAGADPSTSQPAAWAGGASAILSLRVPANRLGRIGLVAAGMQERSGWSNLIGLRAGWQLIGFRDANAHVFAEYLLGHDHPVVSLGVAAEVPLRQLLCAHIEVLARQHPRASGWMPLLGVGTDLECWLRKTDD